MTFDKRSLLFGLGIGLIFISLLLYISCNFIIKFEQVSAVQAVTVTDEEVVERAKKLGMIYVNQLPSKQTPETLSDAEIIERAKGLGMIFSIDNNDEVIATDQTGNEDIESGIYTEQVVENFGEIQTKYVNVEIPKGASAAEAARILYNGGAVDSAEKFTEYLLNKKITKVIKYGKFKIAEKSDYEGLVKLIT